MVTGVLVWLLWPRVATTSPDDAVLFEQPIALTISIAAPAAARVVGADIVGLAPFLPDLDLSFGFLPLADEPVGLPGAPISNVLGSP